MFSWLDRLQPFGALVLRLVVGAIMVAHGYQKVIPRGALYKFVQMVTHMGLPPWLGYTAAFTEFFGGILLIVGLLTRLAAFLIAIDMAVAVIKVHLPHGLTGPMGFEYPLVLFAAALMLVTTGAGLLGLDDLVGRGGGVVRSKPPAR